MGADRYAARFRKLDRLAHDVGIAGVIAAGDVDAAGKLDHLLVMAHFPGPKALAEIAVEIDVFHVPLPLLKSCYWFSASACQVRASIALTALPATLTSCSAAMLSSRFSMARTRSGRPRSNLENALASAWASCTVTALKRNVVPAGVWARRPRSAEITVAILG